MRSLSIFAATFVVSFLNSDALWSQSADTGILGAISDPSGAVVAGAAITVTQPATGIARAVQSDPTGAYEVRYLTPGVYVVEVRTAGFRSEKSSQITLRIGQMARLDFKLQVGDVTEQVQVIAEGVLLETQSGVVADVVTPERIVNLPLNGRNFVQLGNLTPGVVASGGSFQANGARSQYQQVSFGGVPAIRNRENSVRMFPSIDAVQEFKVQSSNYTAEYGGHAGANVQLQLRSGSNALHGTLFEFVRNDIWDARGYYRPAPQPKPKLRRNQFGGVASGPVLRDKTFFMGSYEGLREIRETASAGTVLTEAMRQGDFSAVGNITDPLTGQSFANRIIPSSRLNPTSVKLINSFMPLPNAPGIANNLTGVSRNVTTQDQYMTRIDHRIGSGHQLVGHYLYTGQSGPSTTLNPNFGGDGTDTHHNIGLQYLHTFSPTTLNEFRFGHNRDTAISLSPRSSTDFSIEKDLGIMGFRVGGPNGRPLEPYEVGFPVMNIQGFLGLGDATGSGIDKSRNYLLVDNLSLIRGRHGLKMGIDARYLIGDAASSNAPRGLIGFTRDISGNAASAYMLGFPKSLLTPEGIPISGIRRWMHGIYFQDDWKVNNRLTLNLGLRYDLFLLPRDINGVSRTLRFDLDPKGPVLFPEPGQTAGLWLTDYKNFAPRFGFAYRLRNNMVVRGGYGVFTMGMHFDQINTLQVNPPTASIQLTNANLNPVATISDPFPLALIPTPPIYNITSVEPDRKHKDGYYQNWNLSVGYELSKNDVLEVRYAGAKGTHLDTSFLNFNSPDPDPSATTIQSRRPYPQYGRIRMWNSDGNSNYHSMQTRFEHKFAQGLSLTVAHTWSHLIDDQGSGLNSSRAKAQNPRDVRGNMRADSATDLRHNLVIAYVWEMPFGSRLTGITGAVLKGWMFGGIVTWRTGSHLFVDQDGDNLNIDPSGPVTNGSYNEIRPDLVVGQKPNLPSSERTLDRWFNTAAFTRALVTYGTSPRNPVDGPGLKTWDLSMAKYFPIREGHRLEFRLEAFNGTNSPQFGNPNTTLGNANFGRISSTRINNRESQLALKYYF